MSGDSWHIQKKEKKKHCETQHSFITKNINQYSVHVFILYSYIN